MSVRLRLAGAVLALATGLVMLAAPTSCAIQSLPSDEVCKDVGYSIANRILSCTGDDKRSRQLYAAFERDYQCRVFKDDRIDIPNFYQCPAAVRDVPCDEVIAYGDALDDWLAPLPYCAQILERADGTPIPPVADGGVDASDGDAP